MNWMTINMRVEDFAILERSLVNLDYIWTQAGMHYTPEIHGVLSHAAEQINRLGGMSDRPEDDLEHLHQTSKQISHRTSKIKNKIQQAESHSKIETMLNNKEIKAVTNKVKRESKREFKKRRVDGIASGLKAKVERDQSWLETLSVVEEKPYAGIISFYENERAKHMDS